MLLALGFVVVVVAVVLHMLLQYIFQTWITYIHIIKLWQHSDNPTMMLFSPLILFKYLVFLVSLVAILFATDVIIDEVLENPSLSVYTFDVLLASGSFGVMMITKRVYEQVVHPTKDTVKRQMRKEMDEVTRKRMRFQDDKFKEDNR